MADQPQPQMPPVIDPDNIPETLCDGQFNIVVTGPLATFTFTHWRSDAPQLFAGTMTPSAVVRARIVIPVQSLISLRETLNSLIQPANASVNPTPATGGPTKH
jgi:hypothetical protein